MIVTANDELNSAINADTTLQDASAEECLKMAVAFGTAACLTEGTNPPRKEDVEALLPLVTVESIL